MQNLEPSSEDVFQVLTLFWRLVKQHWPNQWSHMLMALDDLLHAAQQESGRDEPDALPEEPLELPVLGVDLPCFPPISRQLTKEMKDLAGFSVQDLLSQGLELQDSFFFRCWYCEVDVALDKVPEHILPCYQSKKQKHQRNCEYWSSVLAYFKKHGWQEQGLKVKGRCVTCKCSGEVQECIEESTLETV